MYSLIQQLLTRRPTLSGLHVRFCVLDFEGVVCVTFGAGVVLGRIMPCAPISIDTASASIAIMLLTVFILYVLKDEDKSTKKNDEAVYYSGIIAQCSS